MTVQYIPDPVMAVYAPLWWHERGLTQTATGYGLKLTTPYKVSFNGRLYRVYATCISNAASHWILARGIKLHLREYHLDSIKEATQ